MKLFGKLIFRQNDTMPLLDISAYHHWFPPDVRMIQAFHRSVEAVAIAV